MSGFRILDQFPVFLDRLGVPAAGGRLDFFIAGTTTPKNVFADPDLTVNNGVSVSIGADGRATKDIWGSGTYYVRLVAADNTLIADADDVAIPGGQGAAIPALSAGQYLTNDGAVMAWASILQVPDPTGQAGKILGTDGTNPVWQAPPKTPDPATSDVDVTTTGVTISDGTAKLMIITGTATAPNKGGRNTDIVVPFATPFKDAPLYVGITPQYAGNVSAYGNAPIPRVANKAPTGFSAAFTAGELDDSNGNFNFNTAITFDWIAIGLVNV